MVLILTIVRWCARTDQNEEIRIGALANIPRNVEQRLANIAKLGQTSAKAASNHQFIQNFTRIDYNDNESRFSCEGQLTLPNDRGTGRKFAKGRAAEEAGRRENSSTTH